MNIWKEVTQMDYKLTIEVLEARIAPVGISQGGQ
jgi:hypothetical protein